MRPSTWSYYTSYQSEVNKALQQLRHDIFRRGEFYKSANHWRTMTREDILREHRGEPRTFILEALDHWLAMAQLPEPRTIEDWLIWNTGEGTHSILDIRGVSDEPEYGMAAPLPEEAIPILFGTPYPTRRDIERQAMTLSMLREPEQGTYIIVYQHQLPHQIYFTGMSGA